MKTAIIVSGASGSGKSTFAELFTDAVVCTADDYFMEEGEYKFDFSKLGEAHDCCREMYQRAIDMGFPCVIVNNTTTRQEHAQPYIDYAEERGYVAHWVFMAHHHNGESVHGVPEKTLEKQKEQLAQTFKELHECN